MARLADEVVAEADRRRAAAGQDRPIVCASGLSPSGPIHLGNLREVMVPHLVADEIARRGRAVEHLISWDDYDRFRKVPAGVPGVDASWAEHIGKPLTSVPAPAGSPHANWAEHFKAAMVDALNELGVRFRGISQTQMYTSGAYRDEVLHAMARRADIDAVLDRYRTKKKTSAPPAGTSRPALDAESAAASDLAEEGSGAAQEDDGTTGGGYFPFKPYSLAFGTDETRVLSYDDDTTELTYVATGPGGEQVTESMRLDSDFRGKLVWKVDWPMRWAREGVDFEPSGVDHQSPGSSFVVGGQLVEEIFGGRQPIGPMYAFVGISGMAKMSSSRGGVPTPGDALRVMEAPLLRWLYVRRRPNQSFTVALDAEIQRLYDEWDALGRKVGTQAAQPGDLAAHARSVRTASEDLPLTPRPVPFRAIASVVDITGADEEQSLRILRTVDPHVETLDDVRPRFDRAVEWIDTYVPDEDRIRVRAEPDVDALDALSADDRAALDLLLDHLEDDWSLDGLTTLVYGVPKLRAGLPVDEKKLPPEVKAAQRSLFALLYRLLIGSDTGPRIPTLLLCIGPERVRPLLGRG